MQYTVITVTVVHIGTIQSDLYMYIVQDVYYVVVVTGLIGVHEMIECTPIKPVTTNLVLYCRPSPLAYPTDTTILLVTSYLPMKTLVAR